VITIFTRVELQCVCAPSVEVGIKITDDDDNDSTVKHSK